MLKIYQFFGGLISIEFSILFWLSAFLIIYFLYIYILNYNRILNLMYKS